MSYMLQIRGRPRVSGKGGNRLGRKHTPYSWLDKPSQFRGMGQSSGDLNLHDVDEHASNTRAVARSIVRCIHVVKSARSQISVIEAAYIVKDGTNLVGRCCELWHVRMSGRDAFSKGFLQCIDRITL